MMQRHSCFLPVILALVGACNDGANDDAADASSPDTSIIDSAEADARDGFWLTGTVRAETGTIPAAGKLLAIWLVTDDDPRTGVHKRGEVLRSGDSFEMPVAVPPDEAYLLPGLATAVLAEVAADTVLPDGDVDGEQLLSLSQGLSTDHAVFYRSGAVGIDWVDALPLGFSCGRCVHGADEDERDRYEAAPCDEIEVVTGLGEEAAICNAW
jgi:hypothetical protein